MLKLAISPCPNDTFAFYALLHGKTSFQEPLDVQFADIEDLNQRCLEHSDIDIGKVSFHAYLYLKDRYHLLNAGSALGFGCGPLLVADSSISAEMLRQGTIAIPGRLTTATLLLKLWLGPDLNLKFMRFDRIMPAVAAGQVDAGLIIHESRFTYTECGLHCLVDLGEWWERETKCAIPLGGIVASRRLSDKRIAAFDHALGESIDYAWAHTPEVTAFMRDHAQEMALTVMQRHVALYVNSRTRDLGPVGLHAIETLFEKAEKLGLIAKDGSS